MPAIRKITFTKGSELKVHQNILNKLDNKEITVREGAKILNIPKSTFYDRMNRLRKRGNLIHGNTGKVKHVSKLYERKEEIKELCNSKYKNFGISQTSELLHSRENITINKETLRRWLNRDGRKKKKLSKQRIRREPRPNFGDLIQLDGSFDYWFNGTKTCLINMVDDATGISELHFDKEETIVSVCKTVWNWFLKYGTPKSFYVDGRNMYHLGVNSEHNFFTNMCKILNIKVILSKCPQGKGRVERENGVHQKRLIPLFELDNIKSIEEANRYLEEKYIDEHNSKFSHKPSEGNVHTKLLNGMTMDDIFYIETERRLNNDWTFSYNNRYYQIPKQSKYYPPSKSKIQIKVTINGTLIATYRDLEFKMNVDNDYIQDTSDIKRTKDDDIKKEDTVLRREV